MSDRALIVFTDGAEVTPGVYLHSRGSPESVREIFKDAYMRRNDPAYSVARFCGAACDDNPTSVLGVGLYALNADDNATILKGVTKEINAIDHGGDDNGLYVIDVRDFSVRQYHNGKMKKHKWTAANVGD